MIKEISTSSVAVLNKVKTFCVILSYLSWIVKKYCGSSGITKVLPHLSGSFDDFKQEWLRLGEEAYVGVFETGKIDIFLKLVLTLYKKSL